MIQPIVLHPDPILKEACVKIPKQEELWDLRRDLWDTLCHHGGYGLSAPQIGRSCRAFIYNGIFCVDPVISKFWSDISVEEEGCLSIPGTIVKVGRPTWIKANYTTLTGQLIDCKLTGLDARVFQHELDHLNGILILDRVKANGWIC